MPEYHKAKVEALGLKAKPIIKKGGLETCQGKMGLDRLEVDRVMGVVRE